MTRIVKLATVQPPFPSQEMDPQAFQEVCLDLLDQSTVESPDLVCLPEYFNCLSHMVSSPQDSEEQFGSAAYELLERVSARAHASQCYIVLPLIIEVDGKRYNRAHLLGRDGQLIGHFDKVHVTQVECDQFRVVAGSEWPVFDLDFGRVGIMICYDGCFTESPRMLAVNGAEIILWPSLQRSYTREELELQTTSHAYFNYTVVVRSSYGGQASDTAVVTKISGLSSICGADGKMISKLDGQAGWIGADIDLDLLPRGARTHGGEIGCLRKMRFEDRRPATYQDLASSLEKDYANQNGKKEGAKTNGKLPISSQVHSNSIPSPHVLKRKIGQRREK